MAAVAATKERWSSESSLHARAGLGASLHTCPCGLQLYEPARVVVAPLDDMTVGFGQISRHAAASQWSRTPQEEARFAYCLRCGSLAVRRRASPMSHSIHRRQPG